MRSIDVVNANLKYEALFVQSLLTDGQLRRSKNIRRRKFGAATLINNFNTCGPNLYLRISPTTYEPPLLSLMRVG